MAKHDKLVKRPYKPEKARTEVYRARFRPPEAERLDAAIAASGLIKSEWIRQTLLAAAPELETTLRQVG